MKNIYDLFAEEYLSHLDGLGYDESGMILFREKWDDGTDRNVVVRVALDEDRLISFEYDFYEGQECLFIAALTDTEIARYLLRGMYQ